MRTIWSSGRPVEDDARGIRDVLPKWMSKYGLTVHPEKTRLVRFAPPDVTDSATPGQEPRAPRTFDFLGFTRYWGRSQRGGWVVKRKTAKSRLKRSFQRGRRGAGRTSTARSRSNTRSSSRSCKVTMALTHRCEDPPAASRHEAPHRVRLRGDRL